MKANYRAVMVCSESLLFYFFLNNIFELIFELLGDPPNESLNVIYYTYYYQSLVIGKLLI